MDTAQTDSRSTAESVTPRRSVSSVMAPFLLVLFICLIAASGVLWYLWQQSQATLESVKTENATLKFNLEQTEQEVERLERDQTNRTLE